MSDPSGSSTPKAIGSLAKKQSDVTRQGTQKLKFVPTLPQRRKKEDVKQEPGTTAPPSPTKPARGRGSGRGEARGTPRGRGRGFPPAVEMTASGPFALGPSQAGRATDRSVPHSTFAPVNPSLVNTGLSQTAPSLGKDGKRGTDKVAKVEDEEVYSDPDEGVEIVDMDQVRKIDWMAPDILPKERRTKDAKQEKLGSDMDAGQELDLNDSEREELEDLIGNFTARLNADEKEYPHEQQLYLFQFPSPFPTFIKSNLMDVDQPPPPATEKKVTFAAGVKPEAPAAQAASVVPEATEPKVSEPVSGAIGQLEVYRSGAVKMRLSNDILLDVSASTQPSFLQHAVHLDKGEKQLVVLGEVNKQFVVSPNVEALLSALDKVAAQNSVLQNENLIKVE